MTEIVRCANCNAAIPLGFPWAERSGRCLMCWDKKDPSEMRENGTAPTARLFVTILPNGAQKIEAVAHGYVEGRCPIVMTGLELVSDAKQAAHLFEARVQVAMATATNIASGMGLLCSGEGMTKEAGT